MLTLWPAIAVSVVMTLALAAQGMPGTWPARAGWFATAAAALAFALGVGFNPMVTVIALRIPTLPVVSSTLSTILGSSAGYITVITPMPGMPKNIPAPRQQMYFVDGHNSHFITLQDEVAVGMMASKVINAPFNRSIVVGLGSGQSAYGVAAISKHTDIVEISPAVVAAIPSLGESNHHVLERPDVTLRRDDGLNYVRHCSPHSVDFIFNTSTYAMMFNAYKLYTDEFVSAAQNCMTDEGILELYVDWNIASRKEEVRTFLAPVARHFKHIYFSPSPYPIILASNRELSVGAHADLNQVVPSAADRSILRTDRPVLETISCSGWVGAGPLMPTGSEPMSTLDHPYIETTSAKLRIFDLTHHKPRKSDLYTILRPYNPALRVPVCMSHAGWTPPPAWFTSSDPLNVPLHSAEDEGVALTGPSFKDVLVHEGSRSD
jgi:spermidine synthase